MIFKILVLLMSSAILLGCREKEQPEPQPEPLLEIRGADMSFLPEVRQSGLVIRNNANLPEDMLATLQNSGANVVRLRLWNNPATPTSGFETVRALSTEIKNRGMKVMLSLHYSDSWADPGKQTLPALWQGLPFTVLLDSVHRFTHRVVSAIRPEYIQIGNEINSGLLWPHGHYNQPEQMRSILQTAIAATRNGSPNTKIILHFAGLNGANHFFTRVSTLDYDIMGISYYPKWHGSDLSNLRQTLTQLANIHQKPIFIAETSYPFTMGWNDWTNNVVGEAGHLVPGFAATPEGQRDFLREIRRIVTEVPNGIGFVYWGAEWISYRGPQATDGSTWENQALWDFNNRALPALTVFGE